MIMQKSSLSSHKDKCVIDKPDKSMLMASLKRQMLTLD